MPSKTPKIIFIIINNTFILPCVANSLNPLKKLVKKKVFLLGSVGVLYHEVSKSKLTKL